MLENKTSNKTSTSPCLFSEGKDCMYFILCQWHMNKLVFPKIKRGREGTQKLKRKNLLN